MTSGNVQYEMGVLLCELLDLSGKRAPITRSIDHPVPPIEMSSSRA